MYPPENKNTRICILILGMHRSGTSATSGCLSLFGFRLGKKLVPAGEPNEKGYFENDTINRFNENLLDFLNARWHDTLFLPDEWWREERVRVKSAELMEIINDEFDPVSDFIIKDPRISVLLPFYLDTFRKMSILPKLIINFRNPFEVAASLKKRDNLSLSKSLLLWMDANLKAEQYSRTLPRLFVNYNSLLDDPLTTIQKIAGGLELNIELAGEKETELRSFIEKRLKHHTNDGKTAYPDIPETVYHLFDFLKKTDLRDTTPPEQKIVGKLSRGFYSGFRFFNGIDKELQVVLKTIDDNSKSKLYSAPAHPGLNKIRFFPDRSNPVAEYIIYPINRRAALQLLNLKVKTTTGEYLPVEITETNAEKVLDNGTMIFESEFPWLRIKPDQAFVLSEISFEFQLLAISDFTYRFSIQERNLYEAELLSKIAQLQTENNNLIAAHETIIKKLETEIIHLQNENNNLVAVHRVAVEKLKSEIDHLKTEQSNLITANEMTTIKLEHELKTVQASNSSLKTIQHEEETFQKKINKLNADYKREIKQLQEKNSKLESEHLARLNKFETEYAKLSEELRFNQKQLQLLMDTRSWKIGRSVTWPYRILKEKYKNHYEK
ncbi:MAG: hypothetical protein L3J31_00150 [Bacteroidales bacterium]|nr:hypothetical protein [Bacteroidales bacterium]